MAKILTVYYSRKGENYMPGGIAHLEKGHTERAAEFIAHELGTDIFEIDTVKPYAENYRACCAEAVEEMKSGARPAIKNFGKEIDDFDVIFVCYPCWCGTAPMCVFTYLEHFDFTGKKVAPLCSNEGSGMGNSEADLARSCPGATILPGLSVRGHETVQRKDEILAWAKGCLSSPV